MSAEQIRVVELYGLGGEAMAEQRITSLTHELRNLMDDDDTKVIVLRVGGGEGPFAPAPPAVTGPIGLYQTVCFSRKPVLVELDGVCAGPAMLLALYSDVTVAAETSTLHSPFAALPEANMVVAALTMRLNRAKAWLLDPAPLTAAQAERVGLVTEVVKSSRLRTRSAELAQRMAGMPADSISVSKMNINACMDALGVGHDFDLTELYAAAAPAGVR